MAHVNQYKPSSLFASTYNITSALTLTCLYLLYLSTIYFPIYLHPLNTAFAMLYDRLVLERGIATVVSVANEQLTALGQKLVEVERSLNSIDVESSRGRLAVKRKVSK